MADLVKDGGSKEANEKHPKGGLLTGKNKWYVIGGLGVVAVLVFFFVSKSNSSAAGTAGSSTGTASGTTDPNAADPTDLAALEAALQGTGGVTGAQGPAGPAGPAGVAGAAGAAGATGKTGATGKAGAPGKSATPPAKKPAPITGANPPKSKTPPKKPPVKTTDFYTVKPGDSLSAIASKLDIKGGWTALYNENRTVVGSNPNLIHPGMRLKI
jgi:LysM repeat protein